MKVGTKSVLFGAHCFLIHPIFVAIAWTKLYGFPWDPRLWVAFFVHDLGYWGKPNMDGKEGETHVELGADIMFWLFDAPKAFFCNNINQIPDEKLFYWGNFTRYHSRFYAKRDRVNPSRLCVADKMAIALEPSWLYLPRANWSGEIEEYMSLAKQREAMGEKLNGQEAIDLKSNNQKDWFKGVQAYMLRWVEAHKDEQTDHWTPETKQSVNQEGVWQ